MTSKFKVNVDLRNLAPDDPFVLNQLSTSVLPGVVGDIVEKQVTTDLVMAISMAIDRSRSMWTDEIVKAVIKGYEDCLKSMAKQKERRGMFLQTLTYSDKVDELHTFSRLVKKDGKKDTTINVPLLDTVNYDPSRGSSTASVDALMKAIADNLLFEKILQDPNVDAASKHAIGIFSDGFVNVGSPAHTAELRRAIKRQLSKENWSILAFCVAHPEDADEFADALRREVKDWSGSADEAVKLMFETMMHGWGSYCESTPQVDMISDPAKRASAYRSLLEKISDPSSKEKALLYLDVEKAIRSMGQGFGYIGDGGFGIPLKNIYAQTVEPEDIAQVFGTTVSSSLVSNSRQKVGVTSTPLADDTANSSVV